MDRERSCKLVRCTGGPVRCRRCSTHDEAKSRGKWWAAEKLNQAILLGQQPATDRQGAGRHSQLTHCWANERRRVEEEGRKTEKPADGWSRRRLGCMVAAGAAWGAEQAAREHRLGGKTRTKRQSAAGAAPASLALRCALVCRMAQLGVPLVHHSLYLPLAPLLCSKRKGGAAVRIVMSVLVQAARRGNPTRHRCPV